MFIDCVCVYASVISNNISLSPYNYHMNNNASYKLRTMAFVLYTWIFIYHYNKQKSMCQFTSLLLSRFKIYFSSKIFNILVKSVPKDASLKGYKIRSNVFDSATSQNTLKLTHAFF